MSDLDLTPLEPNDTKLTSLRARLASDAQQEGLLDIAYATMDSPIGELLLAATDQGLVRVAFECEGLELVLESLAARVGPRVLWAPDRLATAVSQLEDYFGGTRRRFELPLDLRLSSGFRLTVLRHLEEIGYGRTESYTEVAVAAGNPRAVRAVGTACATNPLPVVVPCHRVLRSDGTLGGYLGGLEVKRNLLALEAAA
jgi:methylated-DNA-[protein]-cysteine S-methyltransferase